MANDPLMDLMQLVAEALENERASYAVTGSVASSIHGEPVTSLDVLHDLEALAREASV